MMRLEKIANSMLDHVRQYWERDGLKLMMCILGGIYMGWASCQYLAGWGSVDSLRSIESMKYFNLKNPVKIVKSVDEKIRCNTNTWQPVIYRDVKFEDSSGLTLRYHHHWILEKKGNMFDPKPGEKYEIFNNQIIMQRR